MQVTIEEMPHAYFDEERWSWEYDPMEVLESRMGCSQLALEVLRVKLPVVDEEYKESWKSVCALFKKRVSMKKHPDVWMERLKRYANARKKYKGLIMQHKYAQKTLKVAAEALERRRKMQS